MSTKGVVGSTVPLIVVGAALIIASAPPAATRLKIKPNAAFNSPRFQCPATAARVSSIIGHRMIQQSGKLECNFAEHRVNGSVQGIYVLLRSSGEGDTDLVHLRAVFVRLNRGSGCAPVADYPALGREAFVVRCLVRGDTSELVIFRSPNNQHTWKVVVEWLKPWRDTPPLSVIDHQLRDLVSG